MTGLIVLGIVLAVQQIESNVLEPLILGILGAFLAVPVVAITARIIDILRGREPAAAEG